MNVNLVDMKDLYLFNTGELYESYRIFGAHHGVWDGVEGVRFAVWAPHAEEVRVAGDFNGWNGSAHPMRRMGDTGVWLGFVEGLGEGAVYKYEVTASGRTRLKADPFAFYAERRPATGSIVKRLDRYAWTDQAWQARKRAAGSAASREKPMLIYEVHLGSWRYKGKEHFYTYRELASELVDYAAEQGYTHLELLPLSEHPLDASWGYQTTGYYAATSRYGPPEQLMELVDRAHARGLGVLLDWVPGHFCKDDHGLRQFDGSPAYEPADSRLAEKPLWGTLAFDFSKSEVHSFLISNAMYWLDVFHFDGLRVDAVASMLNRNFDKPDSMRTFNADGTSENRDAIAFLRKLNDTVARYHPGALMMAEDSSDYPHVTGRTADGGLGFAYKWNMGWMNDMLRYMQLPPEERRHRHRLVTFSMMYAYSERFILPLSHDEVVHGKRSLLNKMPGDYEAKFAGLRLFLAYWMTHPGKKLLFMGGELAQFAEWKDAEELDWLLLQYESHRRFHTFMRTLNRLYTKLPALWEFDFDPAGFQWIDADNASMSVIAFTRYGRDRERPLVVVCNFSERAYERYRIGVPLPGRYTQILNTDAAEFQALHPEAHPPLPKLRYQTEPIRWHGAETSLEFTLPGLSCLFFTRD